MQFNTLVCTVIQKTDFCLFSCVIKMTKQISSSWISHQSSCSQLHALFNLYYFFQIFHYSLDLEMQKSVLGCLYVYLFMFKNVSCFHHFDTLSFYPHSVPVQLQVFTPASSPNPEREEAGTQELTAVASAPLE